VKYKKNPWPTDSVSKKHFDRTVDKFILKHQIQGEKLRKLRKDLEEIRGFLESGPHASAYVLYLQQESATLLSQGDSLGTTPKPRRR